MWEFIIAILALGVVVLVGYLVLRKRSVIKALKGTGDHEAEHDGSLKGDLAGEYGEKTQVEQADVKKKHEYTPDCDLPGAEIIVSLKHIRKTCWVCDVCGIENDLEMNCCQVCGYNPKER